jgi:hypothetical protein
MKVRTAFMLISHDDPIAPLLRKRFYAGMQGRVQRGEMLRWVCCSVTGRFDNLDREMSG